MIMINERRKILNRLGTKRTPYDDGMMIVLVGRLCVRACDARFFWQSSLSFNSQPDIMIIYNYYLFYD